MNWCARESIMKTTKKSSKNAFIEVARRAVRTVGWDPRYDLQILRLDGSTVSSTVRYGYRASKIRLVDSPSLLEDIASLREMTTQAGLGESADCFKDVIASRVYMQYGGWDVCPYSTYDYAEILEATAEGLRSTGMQEPQVQEFVVAVTSFFVASVISCTYAIDGPGPDSFRRGWHLDQIVPSQVGAVKLPMYTSLYAAVQLRLWADNPVLAAALRDCFARPFDALDFEADRGLAILLDSFEFADSGRDGLAWLDGGVRELILDELKFNYRDWPIKAFQFAELLAPYVGSNSQNQQPPQPSAPNPGDRDQRPSDQAQQRRAAVQTVHRSQTQNLLRQDRLSTDPLPGTPIDSFADRLARDTWFRQSVLQNSIGQGKGPLSCLPGFDALDVLYRSRSTEVKIDSETTRKRGLAFPIAHLTREELGDNLPGLNNVDWTATRFDQNNHPILFKKMLPITDDVPAKFETGGFPDLLFVVDSSGSMSWDPQAGRGAYDSLLRAVYSILRFLEEQNKIQFMRLAVVNFSGSTLKTSWENFSNVRVVKKMLFNHQGGGTVLDCQAIENLAAQSEDRFLCLMVTDAQIKNADAVVTAVGQMIARGHGFVLIQIGKANPMTQAVKNLDVPVHVIADHTQLQGLCLQYAKQTWR